MTLNELRGRLEIIHSALDEALGDTDITHIEDEDELRAEEPVQWAAMNLALLIQELSSKDRERRMTDTAREIALVRDALRFFVWAAGEGLSPAEDDAPEPETTLFEYAVATGNEDWDNYPDTVTTALTAAYARGIEDSARVVECLLPEQGAAGPQDATDRLIDEVRRSDASAIRALGEKQLANPEVSE